jgi:hypothetical protein
LESLPGPFSPRRPLQRPGRNPVREAGPLLCAPQSPPPGTHLSGSNSPIPFPAPTDRHCRRDSGQTATRASDQGCLMPPRPILSLLGDDCGLYHHLTSVVSSSFHCSAVPSLHGQDVGARSSTMRPHVAHRVDGAGAPYRTVWTPLRPTLSSVARTTA